MLALPHCSPIPRAKSEFQRRERASKTSAEEIAEKTKQLAAKEIANDKKQAAPEKIPTKAQRANKRHPADNNIQRSAPSNPHCAHASRRGGGGCSGCGEAYVPRRAIAHRCASFHRVLGRCVANRGE